MFLNLALVTVQSEETTKAGDVVGSVIVSGICWEL